MMKATNSEQIDLKLKEYRIAFKMQLFKGFEDEYKKRHDDLWPDLKQLLKANGISDYSIFLDETTNSLIRCYEEPKIPNY